MADQPLVVETKGLAELRRALRRMDRQYRTDLDREMRRVGKDIADDAKGRYRAIHPRRRGGRGSQRGIRSTTKRGGSAVALGSNRYPYLAGQEWGSGRYAQFPERNKEGYFFWPSVVAGADGVLEKVTELIERTNRKHFPELP